MQNLMNQDFLDSSNGIQYYSAPDFEKYSWINHVSVPMELEPCARPRYAFERSRYSNGDSAEGIPIPEGNAIIGGKALPL